MLIEFLSKSAKLARKRTAVVLSWVEEVEERFIQSERSERGGPRARPRYPGVESEDHRTTTRRETSPPISPCYCTRE